MYTPICVIFLVIAEPCNAAADYLDKTFGVGGKVGTLIGSGSNDYAKAVAVQADGKIVAAGRAQPDSYVFAVVRYNADGRLDLTFDHDGKVTTQIGQSSEIFSMAIQSDGKIVAAGYGYGADDGIDFTLVRYNTNGSLDTTFGGSGIVLTSFWRNESGYDDRTNEYAHALAIQHDGKIVVAGYKPSYGPGPYSSGTDDIILARYNINGSLDSTFGEGGKVHTRIAGTDEYANAIAIQTDGKIVVGGSMVDRSAETENFFVSRYSVNGSLDATFGDDGMVITPVGSLRDVIYSLAIQTDGKIIAAGMTQQNTDLVLHDFALARYHINGSLDATFAGDGRVVTPFGERENEVAYAVALQPDGKIIAAGKASSISGIDDFALARYKTDGSLDMSFSDDGKLTTDMWGWPDVASSIAIQPDGKVILAGQATEASNSYHYFGLARYDMGIGSSIMRYLPAILGAAAEEKKLTGGEGK